MTKAIAFDMGGVLIGLDYDKAISSFKSKAGFERITEFLDPWKQKGFFSDLESGCITEEEFLEQCRSYCSPSVTLDILTECLSDFLTGIDSRKAEIVRALSFRYPLYLLSNNNPLSMRGCEPLFNAAGIPFSMFSGKFISSDMKMCKPHPDIFIESVRRVGCDPSELVFIDDSPANVAAAQAVGIDARLYRSIADFEDLLSL